MGMAHCSVRARLDDAPCGLAPDHGGGCDFEAAREERRERQERIKAERAKKSEGYVGPPPQPDAVKSYDPPPKHYATDGGMDPWAVWDAFDLDRYTANAVKYLLRAGKKDIAPRLDDLRKARNYINKAIEREELAQGDTPE